MKSFDVIVPPPAEAAEHYDEARAQEVLATGDRFAVLACSLEQYSGLSNDVAERLINAGFMGSVVRHNEAFPGVTLDNEFALRMREGHHGITFLSYLEKFRDLSIETLQWTIAQRWADKALRYYTSFAVPLGALVRLVPLEEEKVAEVVIELIEVLPLDAAERAEALRRVVQTYAFAHRVARLDLEGLCGVDGATELRRVIAMTAPDLSEVPQKPPMGTEEVGGVTHFTTTRPGTAAYRRAAHLAHELRNGINPEVEELICQSYQQLHDQLAKRKGAVYGERLLRGVGGVFGDALPMYRRLSADYMGLKGESFGLKGVSCGIASALSEGNETFCRVLEVDTPYYDALFAEWDRERARNPKFEEVYLGRDGVYAYIARQAQMWARRRKRETSEAPDPAYVVYPRAFASELSPDVKHAYLAQYIADPDELHLFDTGFMGSVPEDILKVLGLPDDNDSNEKSRHIRMLSATCIARVVQGVAGEESRRRDVMYDIERLAKDEQAAEGVYHQQGELRPYAPLETPENRLKFRLIQLALHRHYYMREMVGLS